MGISEARLMGFATVPLWIGAGWLVLLHRAEPLLLQLPAAPQLLLAAERAPSLNAVATDDSWLGVIVAGERADVGAEVGGSVEAVEVAVGAHVSAGAALLRIDPSSALAELRSARAKLEQQRSAVQRAEAELAEASDLVVRLRGVKDGISARQMLAAELRERQLKATLRESEAALGVQQVDLDERLSRSKKHVIRAPFDGVVIERSVDRGSLVVPGQIVVRIVDGEQHVRFAMPKPAARGRRVGDSVRIELEGQSLTATVTEIQPEVDGAAQLVFARAKLAPQLAAPAALVAGARVRVRPALQLQAAAKGGA